MEPRVNDRYESRRLHLGCGLNTPEGWINLDGSWNAWLAKHSILRRLFKVFHLVPSTQIDIAWSRDILVYDVRKKLPFDDNSLDAIYASHFLEHLYLTEAQKLLCDCYRILRPGGVIRMVVPDLRVIVLEYMGGMTPSEVSQTRILRSADQLNNRLLLRSQNPPAGNILYRVYDGMKDFHSHKWMYDADSLVAHLEAAGFQDVKEMAYRESRIEGIERIEEATRVLNGAGVCVEGSKPF